jgi:D-glycero-alpha-D-manno-heptose 1-phosphate guanylyltransferase
MEAIVLAGGLGTRLRDVVADLPKAMAPINGRPFLAFVLDALIAGGCRRAILAVGYKSEQIRSHFGERYRSLPLRYSVETELLGTGGAMMLAMEQASASPVFVLNGDTYLELDYAAMLAAHGRAHAALTIAVHAVPDAGRYGALDIADGRIRGFVEKGRPGPGSINAGVYILARDLLHRYPMPGKFSFETDLLVPHVTDIKPCAFPTPGVFIDIGVPEDYARAQTLLEARHRGHAHSSS